MNTQTIFQAGNSHVVTIPPNILKELNLTVGHKVTVESLPEADAIIIRKKPVTKQKAVTKEFQAWLSQFLDEDKDLLDELAHR